MFAGQQREDSIACLFVEWFPQCSQGSSGVSIVLDALDLLR